MKYNFWGCSFFNYASVFEKEFKLYKNDLKVTSVTNRLRNSNFSIRIIKL